MPMKVRMIVCVLLCLCQGVSWAETSVRFEWQVPQGTQVQGPVCVDLEGVGWNLSDVNLRLSRVQGEDSISVPCQVENGTQVRLWFIPDAGVKPGQKAVFELSVKEGAKSKPAVTVTQNDVGLVLASQDKSILQYQTAVHDVPEGIDPLYKKSGFVHPVWSPDGEVLTAIQPEDHYHHYGIWNPWTKTHIQGREVDFWNLARDMATVRFAGLLSKVSGPVFGGFKVRQEHVDFKGESGAQIALNELLDVRVFVTQWQGEPVWIVDYTSTFNNALSVPVELDAYRYGGGLGYRATKAWTNRNSHVLTSEGKTRVNADGTRARWCDITGATTQGQAGILFLSHTANRQHPEPMRVWPPNATNGYVFFEFCPIRHVAWTLQPNQDYVLRYRMVIHNGVLSPEVAESLWQAYVHPPVLQIGE